MNRFEDSINPSLRRSDWQMIGPRTRECPRYGPSVDEPQKTLEIRNPRAGEGSVSLAYGAFYGIYVDGSGDTYLQGGQVKCGNSSASDTTIADYKVIDAGTGPTQPAGTRLVIGVTLDGYVEDGVLLAGATATAISMAPLATVPDDTLPTVSSYSSKRCYIEVGRWTATTFLPSNVGSFTVSFCGTGSYTVRRY